MPRPLGNTGYQPPQIVDKRNFLLEKAQAVQPFPSSYKTDITAIPNFNQMKISDCVENAITFVKKYHILKNYNFLADLSRRFLAIWTVKLDGFPLEQGTNVQNGLYEAHKRGICEAQYLADDHTLTSDIFSDYRHLTPEANTNGLTHTIGSYAFLSDLSTNGLKNAIYQNGVIIVGALINENWWTSTDGDVSWDAADILPIRPPKTKDHAVDTTLSGHAFVLYGYDEQYFYFRNSFGSTWGANGNGYFKVDEVPFIYEAATIIDLTPAQIQDQKDALNQAQIDTIQVAKDINNLKPGDPNNPKLVGILSQVVAYIGQIISAAFSK